MTTSSTPGVVPTFAADVTAGLSRKPKQLPPKYFYDALGSSLFDAICRLPWYRITRSELALIAQHAPEIIAGVDGGTIVELGCGSGDKLQVLVDALHASRGAAAVHLVDVSLQALERTRERLERAGVRAVLYEGTYEGGLRRLDASVHPRGRVLVLFLGSNIGNFDRAGAASFLLDVRTRLEPGDRLLLGVDLTKRDDELLLAYDDPLGVTAAFNKNVLARINSELGADFDLGSFTHRAVWNAAEQRIEMHLVSGRQQRVTIAGAGVAIDFAAGEAIWTESSYKYQPPQIAAMGRAARFAVQHQWVDETARFALTLLVAD